GWLLLCTHAFPLVNSLETVIGLYGETLEVPCNNGKAKPEDLLITKWKYDKGEAIRGDLLVRKKDQSASVLAQDEYKDRVSMAENSSLLLSAAKLSDQKTFTCMIVAGADITEYPVNVLIHKAPSGLELSEKAKELEIGKPTKLGECVAKDANPAANITWLKDNKPLIADGKGILIHTSVQEDPITGLLTTSSVLEYSAGKEDAHAQFTCSSQDTVGQEQVSSPVTFTITYRTENISLEVISGGRFIEGDNVTLKCVADGNPAPTSFNFNLKGDVVKVENSDSYTLTDVTRYTTGEYKCSLVDDPTLEASRHITVDYLDIKLNPSGKILKSAGDAVDLALYFNASGKPTVSWSKDNVKIDKEPKFTKLTYSDSGRYECEVTMGPLSRKASFELVVEGAPVIRQLSKKRSEDGRHKILICEAEGSPKPTVSWSINGTSLDESPFINGKITHKITVVPTVNLSVSCTVYNELGQDTRVIQLSPSKYDVKHNSIIRLFRYALTLSFHCLHLPGI
uniref:Activated leukocyte cell adhesion molecule b n=1 Tax=Myripristis murdjan TaxID=586833 RepID=A0A667XD11_9TELE